MLVWQIALIVLLPLLFGAAFWFFANRSAIPK